jgi:signal transduction histidine kinase
MIKTILRNLIHNAIKFSFEGGKIIISLYSLKNQIEIQIRDEGQGMDLQIVDAFNTNKEIVSSLGTSGEKGSGLGLSITREFVGILGGKVKLISAPGEGSTFSIKLPNYKS